MTDHPHRLIGTRMLILTAHPDDEAFTCAGLIYANTRAEGVTVLGCATHGARGRAYLTTNLTNAELKALRARELEGSTTELGVTETHLYDYPDSELDKHTDALATHWHRLAAAIHPDIIVGFGPDGYTGHVDHIAAGRVARTVARKLDLPYYAFALPTEPYTSAFRAALQRKRSRGTYIRKHHDVEPTIQISINPVIKYRALQHHQTQFDGLNPYKIFTPDLAEHFLAHEYFVHEGSER